ncbi:hypothetical protein WICPIJ_001635 [Wickerhamomyces pijperi]|uniref:Flavodoxin-like domain-containing protein n=1 Tax=Wickerhamomyces pijperi TaxID=599730 RepID=A0A9P8QB80_WICPI|nr:hypothetical protein WICPIJ_001635 [Wickerhamomyces pijperi]
MVKIAIIQYSTWNHTSTLAKEIQRGVLEADPSATADIYQIAETLPQEVLTKMYAAPKDSTIPVATPETLTQYDAFLFGIPTRFGTLPAQWVEFWGQTGGLWASGALHGKPAGIFVSTGSPNGGQETTVRNSLSILAHHGLIYVPLGYKNTFAELSNLDELHGGSPWGAGALSGSDGSRQPSELELKVVYTQGASFVKTVAKFGSKAPAAKSQVEAAPAAAAATTTETKKTNAPVTETKKAASPAIKEEDSSKCCIVM